MLPLPRFEAVGWRAGGWKSSSDCRVGFVRSLCLAAQFLGRAHGVGGNRLVQLIERSHRPAERARGHDALAVGRLALEIEARDAAQFEDQALDNDTETFSDKAQIGLLQCQGLTRSSR